jgi:hypothetical protein
MKTLKLIVLLVLVFPTLKGNDTLRYLEIKNAFGSFFPRISYENTLPTISTIDSVASYFSHLVCASYSGKLLIFGDTISEVGRFKFTCEFQKGKMTKLNYIDNPDNFLIFDYKNQFPVSILSKHGNIKIKRDSLNRITNADIFYKDIFDDDIHLVVHKVYSTLESHEFWENVAIPKHETIKIERKTVFVQNWKFEYLIAGNDTISTYCGSDDLGLRIHYGKNWRGRLVLDLIDNLKLKAYLIIDIENRSISISQKEASKETNFINQFSFASLQNITHGTYSVREVRDDCRLQYKSMQTTTGEEYKTLIINEVK